ncbi:MAG: argininosuccinate lyase [Sphaerochaetaceae bacterium]|jgi:argininosuccinate lyase|nr:argininosuccinate lyase [Sphaerochaetaceae bacterium]MDD3941412.1 argininosuccinate lyase [Sphaerochaetaceae bacterium]MDX9939655.1 argininosuccinate lyase [Sphaerochaetaceae bacterium]
MGKLWQKDYSLDGLMEEFTVGNDYLLDRNLVTADCLASIAHARTLHRASLLTTEELESLEQSFSDILVLQKNGQFDISVADEDCHTAIEAYLTKHVGEAGKKIHTGRSRNDQVQTALRLWMREFLLHFAAQTALLADDLFALAKEHEFVPMPGRTHMQLAMPSSVGLWAASFAEELVDESRHLLQLHALVDQSPLGSAASYGTSLPLDRLYSADQMGFAKVQNNVLYANNSRGKFEAMVLDGCDYVTLTTSKLAQDLMLFSLGELGYFSLPAKLCTGSSIMPQKKNPDGLELTRSRSAVVSSCSERVKSIIRSLPSGYNRDFQDTKEPLFVGTKSAMLVVRVMRLMVQKLEVNEQALVRGCASELYATDEVMRRIAAGRPFRDVYREVGMDLASVAAYDPYRTVRERTALGTTGNLGLENGRSQAQEVASTCESKLQTLQDVYLKLDREASLLVTW